VLIGSKSIEYTTIEDVPLQLVDIIITTEDKRFRNHYGIDIKALLRAVLNNIQGKPIQ
jgi:membrane peptidoglycan carboxypeptidase